MVDAGGSFSRITKRYSRRSSWVLKGIDLDLQPGSRTLIVGGNGSGKSTLLRIGAGVSWPNSGSARLPDRIGYVPERLAARTRFTGAEYLAHMGSIKKLDAGTISARSRELLQCLDLRPSPNESIESLSKGNRQKLVLAQAFLGPVGLLVLDEPFAGLDPVSHAALGELTDEAQSGGTAVLASSHYPLPEQVDLRQLRIQNGQLAEIRHDDVPPGADAHVVVVELSPTDRRSNRLQLAAIPGVSHSRVEQPLGRLILVTDHRHVDGVLIAAIRQGWSVRSVREESNESSLE
jgi:ABC-type multidrug transport system ATPase subunit